VSFDGTVFVCVFNSMFMCMISFFLVVVAFDGTVLVYLFMCIYTCCFVFSFDCVSL